MQHDPRILMIGCGNMGGAMLAGWLVALVKPSHVIIISPSEAGRVRLAKQFPGVTLHASPEECVDDYQPDIIIIAIKPQMMSEVLPAYAKFSSACFVSIAAGKTIAAIMQSLGAQCAVIRVMPNLPATIGEGVSGAHANTEVTNDNKAYVHTLLETNGLVCWVEEEPHIDAITAISGSGSAYIFYMIEALAESGKALGLSEGIAEELALQTLYGAGLLAKKSTENAGTLRTKVTSKGGTTAAALAVLMDETYGLIPLMKRVTEAANNRAKSLSA